MDQWPSNENEKRAACEQAAIVPEHHCCLNLAFAISKPALIPHQGPNRIVDWYASWNEYRIPVPYDGYTSALIAFCPWCGSKLPPSRNAEWYKALYDLGFDDPGEQQIPAEFNSDAWWRRGDT